MNTDIVEGKWKQMKGSIQEKWGDITNDELDQVEGKREKLIGLVQERYGKSKEDAKREVNDYIDSL